MASCLQAVTGISLALCDADGSCFIRAGWGGACGLCGKLPMFPAGCTGDTADRACIDACFQDNDGPVFFWCACNCSLAAVRIMAGGSSSGFIIAGHALQGDSLQASSSADAHLQEGSKPETCLSGLQGGIPESLSDFIRLLREMIDAHVSLKTSENYFRESESFYRAMFLNMGSSIGVFDENDIFVVVNEQFSSLLGYSREELEGKKKWTEFVVQADLERLIHYHSSRMKQLHDAPPVYEFGMIDRNGIVREMLNHVILIPGTSKSVISLVDITDRKRAEDALIESENLYRAIFENTGNATILVEEDSTISLANTQWVTLSGYSRDELEGKMKWTGFVMPEDLPRMVEYHRKRRENPESVPWMYEFHFRCRNGEIRDMEVHVVMIPGTRRSVASLLDITERKKAENALRESERRLADIIDFLPDSTFAIDRNGRVTAWNRAMEIMTGVSKQEMTGRGDYEYAIPFYGKRRPILIDLAFEKEEVIAEKYDFVRREGGLLVAEVFAPDVYNSRGAYLWGIVAVLHDSSGNIAGAIESIRDISEYRRVEKALRESEQMYRVIFENTGNATVMIEEDTTISLVNSQMVTLSGYSKEEQEGKMSWTSFVVPEDRDRMLEYHKKRRIDSSGIPWKYEFHFKTRSGDIRNVVIHVGMIPGTKKAVASIVDITDRKRSEEERFEMERKLLHAQKLESLGLLAGGIAHDFNNLLLAVLGNLDIALRKISSLEPARANIEQAMTAGRHATELTRQMLAYSGKGSFVVSRVDLSSLVEENFHMLRAAIPKNIILKLDLAADLPPVMADESQIQQVVLNLITNAAEAIGESQGEITLATGWMECNDDYLSASRLDTKPSAGFYVWMEVRDTGCGMDELIQQKLFDPFFSTKFTGRGLGMSAVLGIVTGHNGAIVINSKPAGGTVIRVLFPTVAGCAVRKNHDGSFVPGRPAVPEDKPFSGTVLVVDDEKMVRDLTCEMLEYFGFRAVVAADGSEAVKVFSEWADKITLVILDLTMPKMDGLATFNKLRTLNPGVKVLLASGFSEQEATRRFSGQGLAGFLQKPYSMDLLRRELETITGRAV